MSRVALVTGASRGLGRAIALRLAKDGFVIAVHYGKSRGPADEAVQEIEAGGGQAFTVQAEISEVKSIRHMFEQLDGELTRRTGEAKFDVLVNNAGTAIAKPVEEYTEEDFDYQFALNVKGLFFVTQLALPRLRDGGRIINIGTGLTRFSMPPYAVYAASKGAVDVLTQNLAAQYGSRGITVNTLAPGAIDTDLNANWLRTDEGRAQITSVQAV